MIKNTIKLGLIASILVCTVGCQSTTDAPEVSKDGLELTVNKASTLGYKKEGVDFADYTKVFILPSQVAFNSNWKEAYNRNQKTRSLYLQDEDLIRIKAGISKIFDEVFQEEFDKGDNIIVTTLNSGTIIIKPSVIDIAINAPDLSTTARKDVYVKENGTATLVLEIYDAVTGEILARIIDAEIVGEHSFVRLATRSTNTTAAKNTIRAWAQALRKQYDKSQEK